MRCDCDFFQKSIAIAIFLRNFASQSQKIRKLRFSRKKFRSLDLWADGGLKPPEAPGLVKDPNIGVQLPNPLVGQNPGAQPMLQDYQQIQQLQLLQVSTAAFSLNNWF